jgi:(2S)-methylsuccinyl-CoA dehydrogenase
MSELGVFGLTIPERYGGLGLEKKAMCIVSEELSRGWIGVGSLGTRSEIAAELILIGGTEKQKEKYLNKIASGNIFPTAVFSEPDIGSDLAHLKTRGKLNGDKYLINGNKTWITHGARADLMTLLVRTNSELHDHKGLSMFLAEKPRESDDDFFPADGMSGGEINVIGYRGMKEFDIGFDNFEVPTENLLGEEEGKGFIHLMSTFESARIQTAARAIGVSQNACDVALSYANDRTQFGEKLIIFPRISEKLIMMFAETMIVRQLTFHAANIKDSKQRCDMEAGMAKLLGARVAWSSADNALQIHGGIGFATETPISRILADARILSIFEGTAEIQAQVIARRLMESKNR